jgi:hypothetical protein
MASIIKANQLQDFGGNSIITSDGAGVVTPNADGIKNVPAFLVRLGSSQVVGNNSATKLTFNTEDLDTNSAYDTSNYRFTVPSGQAGTYVFTLNTSANSASDFEPMYGAIFLNGAAIQYGYGRNEYYDSRNLTRQLVLSVGDYVEAYLYQNSGGNVTVQTDPATNNFSGYKIIT